MFVCVCFLLWENLFPVAFVYSELWNVSAFALLGHYSISSRNASTCPCCLCFPREIPGTYFWVESSADRSKWKENKIPPKCEIEKETFWLAGQFTTHYTTAAPDIDVYVWALLRAYFCACACVGEWNFRNKNIIFMWEVTLVCVYIFMHASMYVLLLTCVCDC